MIQHYYTGIKYLKCGEVLLGFPLGTVIIDHHNVY